MVSSARPDSGPLADAQLTAVQRNNNILASPLYTTSALLKGNQFPLPIWRPRSGRNIQYLQWLSELKKLLAALDVTEDFCTSSPPTDPQLTAGIRTKAELTARAAERDKWLAISTTIFWHVLPSLDLTGVTWQRDTDYIATLYNKQLANGAMLIRWAQGFADLSGKEAQYRLVDHVRGAQLKAQSTRAQLEQHAQDLFEAWKLIASSCVEACHH